MLKMVMSALQVGDDEEPQGAASSAMSPQPPSIWTNGTQQQEQPRPCSPISSFRGDDDDDDDGSGSGSSHSRNDDDGDDTHLCVLPVVVVDITSPSAPAAVSESGLPMRMVDIADELTNDATALSKEGNEDDHTRATTNTFRPSSLLSPFQPAPDIDKKIPDAPPPPPPPSTTETWDERIQREIEAAQRAAAVAMMAATSSSHHHHHHHHHHTNPARLLLSSDGGGGGEEVEAQLAKHDHPMMLPPQNVPTDESMTSLEEEDEDDEDNSYNLLQNFALHDPIAKQRLLSFDSKEDIDLAYSRSSTNNLRVEQSMLVAVAQQEKDNIQLQQQQHSHTSPASQQQLLDPDENGVGALGVPSTDQQHQQQQEEEFSTALIFAMSKEESKNDDLEKSLKLQGTSDDAGVNVANNIHSKGEHTQPAPTAAFEVLGQSNNSGLRSAKHSISSNNYERCRLPQHASPDIEEFSQFSQRSAKQNSRNSCNNQGEHRLCPQSTLASELSCNSKDILGSEGPHNRMQDSTALSFKDTDDDINITSDSIFEMSPPQESSPDRWYRKSHVLVFEESHEMDGEGVCVVANGPPSPKPSQNQKEGSRMKKIKISYMPGSLLDDEQSSCSDRPRKKLPSRPQQLQQRRQSLESPSRKSRSTFPSRSGSHHDATKTIAPHMQLPNDDPTRGEEEEKKENEKAPQPSIADQTDRHARFAEKPPSIQNDSRNDDDYLGDQELTECLSATESEVASVDGLPSSLQTTWLMGESPREKMLQSLDGIHSVPKRSDEEHIQPHRKNPPRLVLVGSKKDARHEAQDDDDDNADDAPMFETCFNVFPFCGSNERPKCGNNKGHWRTSSWKQQHDVPLAILDCANIINQESRVPVQQQAARTLVRVASDYPNPSYAETILPTEVDPRMQDWIASQFAFRDRPPRDGSYHLGKSRTVIVHEIYRGNWTWSTCWSPDGALLAVATDGHHLAVIDTTSSTVWRVRHDKKIRSPQKINTTHSIRSIAWGTKYIAIGGTGNAVSILSPVEPYEILHTITATGFVGCLHWRHESSVLAIGSRLDFVMIVRIRETDEDSTVHGGKHLESDVLHRIEYKYWVNSVAFSHDGSCLAVGDSGGIVSVYDYEESKKVVETNMITWFKRKDSILSIEWSPDGKWLYAGGEDRSVTVIDTTYWEIVHRIGQDRWVQCIAASYGGTHVAVGGVSSEISILDVENGWDSVMGIELKGLVPLSAKWHPRDQYLVLTGQDNSVLAVETTNARHVKGHHLHSIAPIRAIEFSPDGRMAIIGNDAGVVTFYSLSGTTFITAYELIIPQNNSMCIQWSLNGMFVIVGSVSSLMVIWRKRNKRQGKKCPPNASGFSIKKVFSDFGLTSAVSIDFQSQYVAVSGDCTRILDVRADFALIREWKNGPYYANAWSPDGRWLAMMGKEKALTIYDTSSKRVDRWRAIFSMKCDFVGRALAWGPLIIGGLLYLAYGGDSNDIYIMEIRTHEGTWETVLRVPRDASINALDWSTEGLLAAGIGNGTVSIVDLAYLQSGVAVNEMDYNWQRQALTCFTEIRRNRGDNSIKSLRWLPAAPGSDRLLAVGGTDGEVEIIDLTERRHCKGYAR